MVIIAFKLCDFWLTLVNQNGNMWITSVDYGGIFMKKVTLSDGEWKLMNLLWEKEPLTIGEMVSALKNDTGWTKGTVFVMLKRMMEKKIVRVDEGDRAKKYFPILLKEEASAYETDNFLSKVYGGSIGMMVASMAGQKALTEEDIEELYNILKQAEKEAGE